MAAQCDHVFTGIIEATAEVVHVQATAGGGSIRLGRVPFAGELSLGESVAVNGCCLTVTGLSPTEEGGLLQFDLLAETLRVTNLGRLTPGSLVNLERALRVGDRLSGHWVQGHVDTVAEIMDYSPVDMDRRLEIYLAPEFRPAVIPRGSITIDGISLTAANLTSQSVVCWIIPHTAAVTNLHSRRKGDLVNVEFDLIGKYVGRWREIHG